MSELTYEELQERLSAEYGEIFYTANDGETYQIGTYEMETDWYVKDYSSQVADAYLLDSLYQGTPLYSDDDEVFSVNDMKSYDLKSDVEDFLETYFRETDIDNDIFFISDNASFDLHNYDLPEEVIDELEHFDEEDMIEASRNAEIFNDDFDYCYKEAKKDYAENIRDEIKSKLNIRYQNGGYPLSGGDIDFSKLTNVDVLLDIYSVSSEWDSHKTLFLTGNEDLLLDNIDVFSSEALNENFDSVAILELAKNRALQKDRAFFLAHTQSDNCSNDSLLVRFASEELKADKDFAMQWLEASKNMRTLQCFSDEIRGDLHVLKHAIEHNDNRWGKSPDHILEDVARKDLAEEFKKHMSEADYSVRTNASTPMDFINGKITEQFMHKLDDTLAQKPLTKAQKLSNDIEGEDFSYKTPTTRTARTKL